MTLGRATRGVRGLRRLLASASRPQRGCALVALLVLASVSVGALDEQHRLRRCHDAQAAQAPRLARVAREQEERRLVFCDREARVRLSAASNANERAQIVTEALRCAYLAQHDPSAPVFARLVSDLAKDPSGSSRCPDGSIVLPVDDEAPWHHPHAPASPDRSELSRVAIACGMRAIKPSIDRCYQQQGVAGLAMVNVVVAKSGAVVSATVSGKFAETPTGRCVESAVRSATLQPSEGASFPYPFSLGRGSPPPSGCDGGEGRVVAYMDRRRTGRSRRAV